MSYALGPVKPHVASAANEIGPRFGIRTVYGFGPGSVANSDHPKGLALDFMTSSKTTGDALASYCIQNSTRLGTKYVIWYKRIWQNGAWSAYSGFNPHYDHVHVSFYATAGTSTVPVSNTGISNPLDPLFNLISDINKGLGWISNPDNIKRIGLFVAGFVLIVIAIIGITTIKAAYNTVKGVVGNG